MYTIYPLPDRGATLIQLHMFFSTIRHALAGLDVKHMSPSSCTRQQTVLFADEPSFVHKRLEIIIKQAVGLIPEELACGLMVDNSFSSIASHRVRWRNVIWMPNLWAFCV